MEEPWARLKGRADYWNGDILPIDKPLPPGEKFIWFMTTNFEKLLAIFPQYPEHLKYLKFLDISIGKIKTFLDVCGGESVKQLEFGITEVLHSSDLFDFLNMMPNLETIYVWMSDYAKIHIEEGQKEELKLPKLHKLLINHKNMIQVYNFFTKFLPANQILEHRLIGEKSEQINESLHQTIRNFYLKQKAIKKLETGCMEMLLPSQILSLDELTINGNFANNSEIITEALKAQPRLKALSNKYFCEWKKKDDKIILKEICKLTQLETLEIQFRRFMGSNPIYEYPIYDLVDLLNSKTLKSLKCYFHEKTFHVGNNLQWISNRYEHIQELKIERNEIDSAEVFECFPNLKILDCKSWLKLNTFAKLLPKLEKLTVRCNLEFKNFSRHDEQLKHNLYAKNFQLLELDTGIVHETLKSLNIFGRVGKFWQFAGDTSEIEEIFPNLEDFKLIAGKSRIEWRHDETSREKTPGETSSAAKFLAKFNEWKNLKHLNLGCISIRFFDTEFSEIAEELKKLAKKMDTFSIKFEDRTDLDDQWQNFSYERLTEATSDEFESYGNDDRDNVKKVSVILTKRSDDNSGYSYFYSFDLDREVPSNNL